MTLPRESYYPKSAIIVRDKHSSAIAAVYTNRHGKPCAAMFAGKRSKPDSQFYFASEENRAARIQHYFEAIQAREANKRARREAEKAAGRGVEVGDIFSSSWGYEQTNVDFYQCVELVGKTMAKFRRIHGCQVESTGWMQGKVKPQPGSWYGDEVYRVKVRDGAATIRGHYARKTDPEQAHFTSSYH